MSLGHLSVAEKGQKHTPLLVLKPYAGENAGQESNSQGRTVGRAGTESEPLPDQF